MPGPKHDWKALYHEWMATTKSGKDFCLEKGINAAAFSKAIKQFKGDKLPRRIANQIKAKIDKVISDKIEETKIDNIAKAREVFATNAPKLAMQMVEIATELPMDAQFISPKIRATADVLDRAGLQAPKEALVQINAPILFSNVTPQEAAQLRGN